MSDERRQAAPRGEVENVGPFDLIVVGGGMAGLCAAIAAARHGLQTALVQDRPVLGGNASSEIRMHICGADAHDDPHTRETGIIEEIRLEDHARNPQRCAPLFDLLLWEKCRRESRLSLFLNTHMVAAEMADERRVQAVYGHQLGAERHLRLEGSLFVDATGDGRLGFEAGADFRIGREAQSEFGEPRAPERADNWRLGCSLVFQSQDMGRPMPFEPPEWAYVFETDDDLAHRHHGSFEYGYWWIEWGGTIDTIRDNEHIRDELYRYLMGVWDHIKNRGDHGAENHALVWVGHLPGKREARRLMGDHILTEPDIANQVKFADAVAYGGWPIDLHPPEGITTADPPTRMPALPGLFDIPYRCLYSRNIEDLFMAGRDISASHVGHGSIRVMATCAIVGQAAGTAATLCAKHNCTPREVGERHIGELQQTLLRDDCHIIGCRNEDADDLARGATASATSETPDGPAEKVLSGTSRGVGDDPGAWISDRSQPMPQSLTLRFPQAATISRVYLTFDTNLSRRLLRSQDPSLFRIDPPSPIPETARDYRLEALVGGAWRPVGEVEGNYQRRRVHAFDPVQTDQLRLTVTRTNGDPSARVIEVRAYGDQPK